jgi:acyl-CoA synthetase (AMP-forming)/AMP-acid ligase II
MSVPFLLQHLVSHAAERDPSRPALVYGAHALSYAELGDAVQRFANGAVALGTGRGERVGIWLEKRFETVVAAFGTAAAGCVFVPLNPLLRPSQVGYILRDCNVRVLVTSPERLALLDDVLHECKDLRQIVVTRGDGDSGKAYLPVHAWESLLDAAPQRTHRVIDDDVLAILYTSGSTGRPKGVVLSHRNMVAGATSVASYLRNCADDTILAALPLSFDAGFSQLTTGFHAGARVVLLNYLVPKDVLNAVVAHRVTGLTAVPPLWIQLSQLSWPEQAAQHVRYIANTGGRMPAETLRVLRKQLPSTQPFLMYGLTEAFRST